ncbi:hypothetical protein [Nocardioides insulae]|uniref:hypothetical protein n=1 Tax=Nocardioides insulae TaxID=394734 RepID=UPI00040A561F|nr:hypothetical protein [Nocardioides insulae]
MIGGHLGSRASALLDGQLSAEDAERAWQHVHDCHQCRDHVEREGWVKRRLAGLGGGDATALPAGLKGALLRPDLPLEACLEFDAPPRRTAVGLAVLGGGAVGAAMMGVLALGAAPASAPTVNDELPLVTRHVSDTTTTPASTPPSPRFQPGDPGLR